MCEEVIGMLILIFFKNTFNNMDPTPSYRVIQTISTQPPTPMEPSVAGLGRCCTIVATSRIREQ